MAPWKSGGLRRALAEVVHDHVLFPQIANAQARADSEGKVRSQRACKRKDALRRAVQMQPGTASRPRIGPATVFQEDVRDAHAFTDELGHPAMRADQVVVPFEQKRHPAAHRLLPGAEMRVHRDHLLLEQLLVFVLGLAGQNHLEVEVQRFLFGQIKALFGQRFSSAQSSKDDRSLDETLGRVRRFGEGSGQVLEGIVDVIDFFDRVIARIENPHGVRVIAGLAVVDSDGHSLGDQGIEDDRGGFAAGQADASHPPGGLDQVERGLDRSGGRRRSR